MKKMLLFLFLMISTSLKAQTFTCTDLNYAGSDLSQREIQNEKKRTLGSKAVLSFFTKDLRLDCTNDNGKTESYVLDKSNDTEYKYSQKTSYGYIYRMVVKLKKQNSFVNGFTIYVYKDYKLQGTVTYKRDI